MNRNTEQDLQSQLRTELQSARQYKPDIEQDSVFQEHLRKHLSEPKQSSFIKQPWLVAAMAVLVIGLAVVIGQNYSVSTATKEAMTIAELIKASNQIESELTQLDVNQLETTQYVEALKIRDEIGQLDSSLNELYQSEQDLSSNELKGLWHKRLQMARQLKAIYTNEYMVARI